MSNAKLYQIICIIPGHKAAFSVDIKKSRKVDCLKKKIKREKPHELAGIDANELTLYQINVDVSDEEKYIEEVKTLAQKLNTLNKLNMAKPLGEVFSPSGPRENRIHILVKLPEAEPRTPRAYRQPDQTLRHTPVKPLNRLDDEIEGFLDKCRPAMRELLEKAYNVPSLLPSWKPGPSVYQDLANHVSELCIPTIEGGQPSLLLHALGEETDGDRIAKVFSLANHIVLLNTTGSGKTRLLLEGLCHRWGFYFVAKRDTTGIGSRDFERFMDELDHAEGYAEATKRKRKRKAGLDRKAVEHIRQVARGRLSQLLLARFLLLDLLIQEAGNLEGGLQQKEHRRLWALLQVQPRILGSRFVVDVFTDLTQLLRGAGTDNLEYRIHQKRAELHPFLPAVQNPATGEDVTPPFFCVLDEVQVTIAPLSGRLGEFMSDNNETPRHILREIWLFWSDIPDMRLVLSGTGIGSQALNETLASNACKHRGYDIVRDIGAFNCRETQTQYIMRYLPAAWDKPQWEAFLDRAWYWLRGRYRNTATLVSLMLEGGYQCPHRTIDEYVEAFTGFTPADAKDRTEREPKLPSDFDFETKVSTLTFKKMSDPQAETLCNIIYGQMLRGHYNPTLVKNQDKKDFVQYGFARHRGRTTVIDEPLAILAAREWLDQNPRFSMISRLHRDIDKHSPRQNGFEDYLTFFLRHVFETAPALNKVFTFRGDFVRRPDLAWQSEEFELVTVVGLADKNGPQISVCTPSSGSSPNVGFSAEKGEKVLEWISTNSGRYTFCFPPKSFGPDLLFFVHSKKSRKILLVVLQAKQCSKVAMRDCIEGVRTVTPSWFWKRKKKKYASADAAPFIGTNCGPKLAVRTEEALANIPLSRSLKLEGAKYPILRVFASWPGEAGLERTLGSGSWVDSDRHPLATLHMRNFKKVGAKLDRNWFQGAGQQVVPSKRASEEPESELPSRKRARLEA